MSDMKVATNIFSRLTQRKMRKQPNWKNVYQEKSARGGARLKFEHLSRGGAEHVIEQGINVKIMNVIKKMPH